MALHEVEVNQAEAVEVLLEAVALALGGEVDSRLAGADEAASVTVAVDEEEEASRIAVAEEVATVEVVEVSIEDAVEEGLAVGAADLVVNLRESSEKALCSSMRGSVITPRSRLCRA